MVSVEFDREVNALYLRLKKGKIEKSEPIADNIVFDLNEEGKLRINGKYLYFYWIHEKSD